MAETTVTSANFREEVLGQDKPVLIDFWAPWCGPCRMLAPIVEQIAEEYADRVKVCKVNVDDEPELASAFNVSAIPMVAVIKDGKVADVSVGYTTKEKLIAML